MIGEQEVLLTAAEVAKLFRVGSKTINRWALEGKLTIIKTAGRHYRYKESEVKLLLESYTTKADPSKPEKKENQEKEAQTK
jgi:excisionase family DNA binding protein